MVLLASAIQSLHFAVVTFITFGSFSYDPGVLLVHATSCLCLLVHWYANQDICSLSLLESAVRGVAYKDTFVHRIVSPIYNISEKSVKILCYTVTITGLLVSSVKLYAMRAALGLFARKLLSRVRTTE